MYFLKRSSAYLGCELQYEHKETAPSTERTSEEQLGHWIVCYTTSPLPRPFLPIYVHLPAHKHTSVSSPVANVAELLHGMVYGFKT